VKPRLPGFYLLLAALVIAASFMAWTYTVVYSPSNPKGLVDYSSMTNAWQFNIQLGTVIYPAWLASVLAIGIAAIASMRAFNIWVAHPVANILLSVAGIAQVGAIIYRINDTSLSGPQSFAIFLTFGCFVVFLLLSIRDALTALRRPPA